MTEYTVCGVFRRDFKRFTCVYWADSAENAEFKCVEDMPEEIVVAGVFRGKIQRVDYDTNDGRDQERYCYRCGFLAGSAPNDKHSTDCGLYQERDHDD